MEEIKYKLYEYYGWLNAEYEFLLKDKNYEKSLFVLKNIEMVIKLIKEIENNDK